MWFITVKPLRRVISFGGSTIYNSEDDNINVPYCSAFIELLKENPEERYLIVVGGGKTARQYINAAGEYEIDEEGQDLLGIEASHLNALLFALLLNKAGIRTYHSKKIFDDYQGFLEQYDVIVTGGTIPGHTTDKVAVQCAAKYGDRELVKVTSVGGIYDDDPAKNESATLIRMIKASELIKVWGTEHTPGSNKPIGVKTVEEALEKNVKVHIVGEDIGDLRRALFEREGYRGTLIIPE